MPRQYTTHARPRSPPAGPGEAATIKHDEKIANREVDLIARKLESGSKPGLKTKSGQLRAHVQQYLTCIHVYIRIFGRAAWIFGFIHLESLFPYIQGGRVNWQLPCKRQKCSSCFLRRIQVMQRKQFILENTRNITSVACFWRSFLRVFLASSRKSGRGITPSGLIVDGWCST